MPPHHFLLGHLGLMASIVWKLPRHVMPTVVLGDQIRQRFPHLDKAFYLDLWPVSPPMLIVLSPDLIGQFTQETSLPKVAGLHEYMKPMSGGYDILTMEGPEWKYWRKVWNPGFTAQDVKRYVPGLVQAVDVFRTLLAQKASEEVLFHLGPMTLNLAMDLAGKAIWSHDFSCQTSRNVMADSVVSQLGWLHFAEFSWDKLNLIRPFAQRYNQWKMNRYITQVLRQPGYDAPSPEKRAEGSTSVVQRAFQTYQKVQNSSDDFGSPPPTQADFNQVLRSQMRFLLLAGYDTTGSSLVYLVHLLSRHPRVLARVRRELDNVLGPDVSYAASRMSQLPHLIHRVPYTTAVIKETLRLYPPASSVRRGKEGFFLQDREPGHDRLPDLPTAGFILFSNHHALHRNPRYWHRPRDFLPERFLDEGGEAGTGPGMKTAHHFTPGSWRPFERGPRQCIGQELAVAELKVVCMLVAREFDFTDAYDEYDQKDHGGWFDVRTVDGDRAYQITRGGGSHPSDWYPCRVKFAEKT